MVLSAHLYQEERLQLPLPAVHDVRPGPELRRWNDAGLQT